VSDAFARVELARVTSTNDWRSRRSKWRRWRGRARLGRRHRFGDREPARFRETWTRPWSLTPQTRGAIFLVFDANRPSFTVYFFPRDGNENERIGTNSARKTKKKKNRSTSCRNATKTTQNERESVFFTNRVAYYAPEGAANVSTASSCV
jgi:hypothetical protein